MIIYIHCLEEVKDLHSYLLGCTLMANLEQNWLWNYMKVSQQNNIENEEKDVNTQV
jgi:hypothetical protein